ncbi:MAG: outer membrane lipoprotein-sorting protein [bacterium]
MTGLLLALTLPVMGATKTEDALAAAQARGLQIFTEADQRQSGYGDMEVALTMILRTAGGTETQRQLSIRQMEMPADGDRVLIRFESPADIRGTALLSHAHKLIDDDQWLFLPALRRVKKVALRNRNGAFLGSEFTFEDLAVPELEKYDYLYLREDMHDALPVHVVQRIARNKYSGYSREVFWLDQEHLRALQVEYFDRQDRQTKRLRFADYSLYADRFWKAGRMSMQNLITGKSTDLIWQDYRFGLGFQPERDFSINTLRRIR